VPLQSGDEVIGMVGVQDYEKSDCYGTHDLEALSVIAGQAAAAIRNARLLDAERCARAELSAAHQRMLEAERLRVITETVGALNHEVNNPLAAIAGFAQLLLKRADLPPEARMRMTTILDEAKRIEAVTSRMGSLIQAASAPYPGHAAIIDVRRSVAREERLEGPPAAAA
jgi:signal transduction histidine kinase